MGTRPRIVATYRFIKKLFSRLLSPDTLTLVPSPSIRFRLRHYNDGHASGPAQILIWRIFKKTIENNFQFFVCFASACSH
jgi:hypothetical protein